MSFDQTAGQTEPDIKQSPPVPHLVIPGVAHTGTSGILGGADKTLDVVYPFIRQALTVASPDDYRGVITDWQQRTAQWSKNNPAQCNATIVFSLKHPGGRAVKDSLILIKDRAATSALDNDTQAILNVAGSIEARQPIQNGVLPSSVSFYVNYGKFVQSYPHAVEITINSGCDEILYPLTSYTVQADQPAGQIQSNEFVYVKVTLDRQSRDTYSVVQQSGNPDIHATWPPMPKSFPP